MRFSDLWGFGLIKYFLDQTTPGEGVVVALTAVAILVCAAIAYLLGSVNVSILISKCFYHDDIRLHGSGNAGATNVMRTYGKKMAAMTFGGDFLKAAIASVAGRMVFGYYGAMIAGLFCIVGHIFPCFYKFKGGKGIVTACAMVLLTNWRVFLVLLAIFILVVIITKFISLGSVVAMAAYPIVLDRIGPKGYSVLIAMVVMALCIYAHRSNIKRIMNHEESRFTFKVKDKKPVGDDGESDSE